MPNCSPGSELVLLAASISIALSADLSADDTDTLASLLNAIGENLSIIAAQKAQCGD
jgi:hypothetical protein